eukprot:6214275-Pleurochrysis_carterae.AAC.5
MHQLLRPLQQLGRLDTNAALSGIRMQPREQLLRSPPETPLHFVGRRLFECGHFGRLCSARPHLHPQPALLVFAKSTAKEDAAERKRRAIIATT